MTICIGTNTIMDGLVLRWYANEQAAENAQEWVSASRNGVRIYGYLHEIPPGVLDDANTAYAAMRSSRGTAGDDRAWTFVTHRWKKLFGHEIEPVQLTKQRAGDVGGAD